MTPNMILIQSLAFDAASHITRSLANNRQISDDDTDYLDSSLDALKLAIPAICDDDADERCDELIDAISSCDTEFFMPRIFAHCIHALAIDFNSPALDLAMTNDDCPNFPN